MWGVGCGVWGVGCGVWGVGCGVWGVGCGKAGVKRGESARMRKPCPGHRAGFLKSALGDDVEARVEWGVGGGRGRRVHVGGLGRMRVGDS